MKKNKKPVVLSKSMQRLFEAQQDLDRMRATHPENAHMYLKHPGPERRTKIGNRVTYARAMTKPIMARIESGVIHLTEQSSPPIEGSGA